MISFSDKKEEIIAALSELVSIPSVKMDFSDDMPFGKSVAFALDCVCRLSEKLGFDFINLNNYLGYVEYGEGDDLIVILTHIDVVPEGDGWLHPCFELTEDDGVLYGRGVTDDKGAAIVSLYALYLLKVNGARLNKKVRLVFGCDEESGWRDMAYYKSVFPDEPYMAFSPDADFPVINYEKGLLHLDFKRNGYAADGEGVRLLLLRGGSRVNIVPDFAECVISGKTEILERAIGYFNEDNDDSLEYSVKGNEIHITARGKSSHGSRPEDGINAIMIIVRFLYNLPLLNSVASDTLYLLGDYFLNDVNGNRIGIACEDESGKLSLNIGIVDITETTADISVDCRYPIITSKDLILAVLSKIFKDYKLTVLHDEVPHYVSPDSELVMSLLNVYSECTGLNATCKTCGGATFARVFCNSVAFGIQFPDCDGREHMSEEQMKTDNLLKSGEIIYKAIYRLCNN